MNTFLGNYYKYKKFIPRSTQLFARHIRAGYLERKHCDQWPCSRYNYPEIDTSIWKEDKKFCLVLTHDVDTEKGIHRCENVMKMEQDMGFRSSFSIVPEKYDIPNNIISTIQENKFEICVHGYNHDGLLFSSKKIFDTRKKVIEHYLEKWNSVGFRAPAMHHNLDWISEMKIEYDMSTYEFDPFEPQGGGVGIIFPFLIKNFYYKRYIVEMPYTLAQDHTLFIVLKRKGIEDWINKIDMIAEQGGMALLITHPDYMNFDGGCGLDEYSAQKYYDFLHYIKSNYASSYWNPLPRELAGYWKEKKEISSKISKNILQNECLCNNCKKNLKKVLCTDLIETSI